MNRHISGRPAFRGLAAFTLVLLAGCAVGPDYKRPETPEPQAWKSDLPATPWPTLTWWQSFQAPTLDRLMEDAQRANFDIAAAVARVRQADAQAKIAGAALLPSVGADLGAERSRTPPSTPSQAKTAGPNKANNLYSATLDAHYELDFWGKNADALEAAEANAQASHFDQETTALTVQANVANTYFTILAYQDRLTVARDNLANAATTLDSIQARASAGLLTALDVAQQESIVAEQRAAIPPLVQALRQNTYALAILVGKLPEALDVPATSLAAVTLPEVGPGMPSDLLIRRPDVQFAEAQLIAANATFREAETAIFPDINLTAEGGVESIALATLLNPGSRLYSLGATLTQPIFEGGILEAGIELQRGHWDEMVQDYEKAAVSAFEDVENALAAVELTAQQEIAQRNAMETARRAYEISKAQLHSGTIDIVTMLNTQRTLFQAEDTLVQVKLAHAQAVVGLFRAWVAAGRPRSDGKSSIPCRPADSPVVNFQCLHDLRLVRPSEVYRQTTLDRRTGELGDRFRRVLLRRARQPHRTRDLFHRRTQNHAGSHYTDRVFAILGRLPGRTPDHQSRDRICPDLRRRLFRF